MSEEKMSFKITAEDGKEIECEVLFTFESDETNKNYIVYTDNTTDEENIDLIPIETEKEWKIIETILNELQAEINGGNEQ